MEIIDLKSREVFGQEGRGVASLVEEPFLKIRQIALDPERYVPVHTAEDPVTIQVVRGEGSFTVDDESVRMGAGKLLRIGTGASVGIVNDSAKPLVFLVMETPETKQEPLGQAAAAGPAGTFVNLVDFAPLKPGKQEAFLDWFRRSSEVFSRHAGFLSRTLLGPIEGASRYAVIVEHESKDSFMDMHLSDDRERLSREVEPVVLGETKPHFYEVLISFRNQREGRR